MAGTCRQCGGLTTNTREHSALCQCFNCQQSAISPLEYAFDLEDRLRLAEEKLFEHEIEWDGQQYSFSPRGN